MECEQRPSGLVVPKPRPQKSPQKYGVLEVQDDEQRKDVRDALKALWDALELERGGCCLGSPRLLWEAHYRAWRYIGEMLLDTDCPDYDVLT